MESLAQRRLTIIDRNAKRLRRLVDDLLLVAEIDADRLSLKFKRTDIIRSRRHIATPFKYRNQGILRGYFIDPFGATVLPVGGSQ